jgi:SnoaL-like protein
VDSGQQRIEWQLGKLNTDFAHFLDRREYESMITLFTPDATYERHGEVLRGHQQIREAMHTRPDLTIRHIVSNLHFFDVTEDAAHGDTCLMAYAGPPRVDGAPAVYSTRQGYLTEVRDTYVRTDDGWRIARRIATPLLVPGPEEAF